LLFLDNSLFKNKIERIRLWNILTKSEKFYNRILIAIPGDWILFLNLQQV